MRFHPYFITPVAAISVVACANTTMDQRVQRVQAIVASARVVLAAMQAMPEGQRLPAEVYSKARAALDTIQASAMEIARATAPDATLKEKLDNAVRALGDLAAPYYAGAPALAESVRAMSDLAAVLLNPPQNT